jgi:hypothetical protein
MTIKEKLAEYPLIDVAVLHHGFAPFMRDYDVIAEIDDAIGTGSGIYRYRFTHCTEAHVTTLVSDDTWRQSWDDLFTDYERWTESDSPDGFVWGVCWSMANPGLTYHGDSPSAQEWSARVQQPMYEVTIETQVYCLKLIFHDVIIQQVSGEANVIGRVSIPLQATKPRLP